MSSTDRIVAVVGPTAAGKSELSIDLAHHLGGEIINADSMQLYRGMDVGTAKLPVSEREGVPHHLLDVLDVTQPASVAEFQGWARDAIRDCHAREVTPILVGGSALYIRAALDVFEFPGTDPALRAVWQKKLEASGPEALHEELASRDAAAAESILPSNGRRIVRALEVIELTGKPFAATLPSHDFAYSDVTVIGIDVPRETLNQRIERRVDRMWSDGLVDEVRELKKVGLQEGPTASRALGYAQILAQLRGEISEDEAREQTVTRTRKFARRQDQWFRKDPRIDCIAFDHADLVDQARSIIVGP